MSTLYNTEEKIAVITHIFGARIYFGEGVDIGPDTIIPISYSLDSVSW